MTEHHDTESFRARQVQMNINASFPTSWASLVMSMGAGIIPPDDIGEPSAELFGFFVGRDADTVRNWVYDHEVLCRMPAGPNGQMFINLPDFRKKCPLIVPVKQKRGGGRPRKA